MAHHTGDSWSITCTALQCVTAADACDPHQLVGDFDTAYFGISHLAKKTNNRKPGIHCSPGFREATGRQKISLVGVGPSPET